MTDKLILGGRITWSTTTNGVFSKQNCVCCIKVVCGMLGAEVRYPNEVSPGDFLSAADVKIVRNAAHVAARMCKLCG